MIHQVWLIPTPTSLYYKPRVVDRLWQSRIELQRRGWALTALGSRRVKVRRNQDRIDTRRALPGYPSTAGDEPHWADVSGLETEEDRRRARNQLKARRRRQGR